MYLFLLIIAPGFVTYYVLLTNETLSFFHIFVIIIFTLFLYLFYMLVILFLYILNTLEITYEIRSYNIRFFLFILFNVMLVNKVHVYT